MFKSRAMDLFLHILNLILITTTYLLGLECTANNALTFGNRSPIIYMESLAIIDKVRGK